METVTSPQLCCWTDRAPGLHSLSNSQFPVLCPSPGNGILLSLSRPSLLMFVARERRGGGCPTAHLWLWPAPHTLHCWPSLLLVLLAGKYLGWRERRGDHSSDILVFNAPLSLALALGGGNERSLFKDFSHQILKNGCNFLQFLANCRAQVRSPKVRSPKVKTKGTWADTKITPLTLKHERVLW